MGLNMGDWRMAYQEPITPEDRLKCSCIDPEQVREIVMGMLRSESISDVSIDCQELGHMVSGVAVR